MHIGSKVKTRYARVGDASVAWQVSGTGPHDVLFLPGFVSNVEHYWEVPAITRILDQFGTYSHLVRFDKRGTGMSDPLLQVPTIDDRLDDTLAVLDDAGLERAHLFGVSEGGPLALLFAATYPERVESLVLYGASARYTRTEDYPFGMRPGTFDEGELRERLIDGWEDGPLLELFGPTLLDDPEGRAMWGRFLRGSASPATALATLQALASIDVRDALPAIQARTLLLHRKNDRAVSCEGSRYMAERIPDCEFLELEGEDHLWFVGDTDSIFEPIERFVTGGVRSQPTNRQLATVLFTDIVDSTRTAGQMGDANWRSVLERHDAMMRELVERYRGKLIKSTGDGVLATFDGPTRALECTSVALADATSLGIKLRAGLHTGECEIRDDDIAGMAVHIAARVSAMAGADEILVSSTVKDLSVGSPLSFSDRGQHELKGVPDEWRIYSVN
ncbi:MAG: adenylate/guanylate cyclase domain-containing protein [Solirubrobacterales bacterium]